MAKRKRKLKKKVFLTSFIIIVFLIGGFVLKDFIFNPHKTLPNKINNSLPENSEENENTEETYEISLIATGDGLNHNAVYFSYEQDDGTYDFRGALKYIKEIVKDYDIAYYNQETPFAGTQFAYSGYPRFNTPSEFGDAMIDAGFNMVSLATNHTMDKGEQGIINFANYWKNKDNIIYNGIATSEDERNTFMIGEKNNITYSMLSYTTSTNGLNVPSGKDYLVNVYNQEQVKKDIESLRDKVDVLIVAMHWGVEYSATPNSEQKEIADYLSNLDVDIIIGTHPHVLQPITKIGDTIVMYSLGNFISNQYGTDDYNKLVGFLATLDITKTVDKNDDVTIKIDNLGGELIFTKYNGNPITTANHDGHVVIPFSMMEDDSYLKDYERIYNKYTDVLNSMGAQLNIATLPN